MNAACSSRMTAASVKSTAPAATGMIMGGIVHATTAEQMTLQASTFSTSRPLASCPWRPFTLWWNCSQHPPADAYQCGIQPQSKTETAPNRGCCFSDQTEASTGMLLDVWLHPDRHRCLSL